MIQTSTKKSRFFSKLVVTPQLGLLKSRKESTRGLGKLSYRVAHAWMRAKFLYKDTCTHAWNIIWIKFNKTQKQKCLLKPIGRHTFTHNTDLFQVKRYKKDKTDKKIMVCVLCYVKMHGIFTFLVKQKWNKKWVWVGSFVDWVVEWYIVHLFWYIV